MARLRFFVAAMAFWLSIASADMASHAHSSTNCTFAERNIKFCRPYLQKANRTLRPSRTCCFVALSIYLVGPECFCDVVNPSSLGVPVNASRVSRLPKLCHLPKGALHCNVPRRSPPPVAHPPRTSPPTPVSSPPANPPSSSISTPPSNPPATPTTDPPSGSVAVPPSNPPSGSVSAPPSNPPSGSVSAPPSGSTAAPPSKPPSGSGAEPPSGSIATPPSNPPTPSVAAPPSWATAPSLSPYSPGHPPETAPAAAPTSSDALKLATSAVGLFVAFASVVVCM
ncbi:hypothetical protein MUK42_29386 [Musa troglodytarum]|uniref:Bifunctional inhibitor/plant lipid transfer protein/seed storage helical domain-containing protein n=1 Tax=Musa troglodytarum TaxID=320322 RepID=A0A9E7JYY6_9LILI|nr:hypothetical protein MUK42_29386 [Musa troglodytarum]